eukprot:COSAG04_NODE_22183_length_359_cov_1.192308_1_plen_98_part_10
MIVRLTPGIGAVTVIPSVGPRGLRVSLCAPGTQKVPPEFSSTSVISAERRTLGAVGFGVVVRAETHTRPCSGTCRHQQTVGGWRRWPLGRDRAASPAH